MHHHQCILSYSPAFSCINPRSSHQQQQFSQQEPERPEAKSSRASKFDNMQMSLGSMRIADPRGNRVKKLLASGVLELSSAKSTILNTLPVSKYDLYMRNLRLANAPVRQMGVPLDQEKRDMDCNTDTIDVSSKSVQFSYGDDTAFYRIIDTIKAKREKQEYKQDDSSTNNNPSNNPNTASTEDSAAIGATRLASFLQNASRVCETLLDERNNSNNTSKQSEESKSNRRDESRSQYSVFDSSKDWTDLGEWTYFVSINMVFGQRSRRDNLSTCISHLIYYPMWRRQGRVERRQRDGAYPAHRLRTVQHPAAAPAGLRAPVSRRRAGRRDGHEAIQGKCVQSAFVVFVCLF